MKKGFILILKDMTYRFKDDTIMAFSAQLCFSIMAAAFPFLIFLISVSSYLSLDENRILLGLRVLISSDAFKLVKNIVQEVLNTKKPHLLLFSLIFGISSLASGVKAVINSLNKAYNQSEKRPFYKIWSISILGTIAIALIITFSFVMLVLGEALSDYLQHFYKVSDTAILWWDIARVLIIIVILLILFTLIYYFLPSKKLKLRKVMPGAVLSTLGWIITCAGFAYYVNNFSNLTKFYGSMDAVFVLMTWVYISSVIIIIGGEFNASLISNRLNQEDKSNRSGH
jgi:membrane protein